MTESEGNWPIAALPWQQESWNRLKRSISGDSIPHALLLSGVAGTGKTHFSRALAALLLCHNPIAAGACGQCRSCHLLQAGSHSDLLSLNPEGKSRVIKIDQVRSLIDFVNQTPALGQRKVVLINPAEALNLNAANALLKCLEEPSAGTYMVLVSHASSSLPATVRSRCQLLNVPIPNPDQSLGWLDSCTGDRGTSAALLAAAGNRPMAALDLYLSEGLASQQALQQSLDALTGGAISATEFPQLVAELDRGDVLGLFTERLQLEIKKSVQVQPSGLRGHFQLLDDLVRLQRAVLRGGNPNRQLTIENCAAQLALVLGAAR